MTKTKPILLLFCGMLLCSRALGLNARPETDAVYHKIVRSYTLNADGSTDCRFRKELQLFTTAAFDTYGETFIMYNPDFETLTVNEAYTIRADGSVVKAPGNAFNPSLPYPCADCERFSRLREMVVTHTALEVNATIVLDYTIHSRHPFMPMLMEKLDLYMQDPVEVYDITVAVPGNTELHYSADRVGAGMLREGRRGDDGSLITHWRFTGLPAAPAVGQPAPQARPALRFSTLEGPETFAGLLSAQNSFIAYTYSEYDDVFARILNDSMADMDRILAVRDYVADNVRLNDIPPGRLDYIIASPHVVWRTHCGTAFEKTLLLQSMLRALHYNAMAGFWAEDLPRNLDGAVRVSVLNRTVYLSATRKNRTSPENCETPQHFVTLLGDMTFCKPDIRDIDVEADIMIGKEGGAVKADVQYRTCRIQSPAMNTIQAAKPDPVLASITDLGAGYRQLHIHDGGYGVDIDAGALARECQVPVAVPPADERYTYRVTLPAGAVWTGRPAEYEKTCDFGSMTLSLGFNGQEMVLKRELHLKKTTVAPGEYPDFRDMMAHWATPPKMMFRCP